MTIFIDELAFNNMCSFLDNCDALYYKIDYDNELVIQKASNTLYSCKLINHCLKRKSLVLFDVDELKKYLKHYDIYKLKKKSHLDNVLPFRTKLRILINKGE